ncbi:MAG: tyrosine-protein phosphatase [Dysgonamonadaceae bacterium]|jgi:protein-tyrosine phosphatase|nr:tyrosine-protein phosphatase [Dysgonamonadaceae bacterium]
MKNNKAITLTIALFIAIIASFVAITVMFCVSCNDNRKLPERTGIITGAPNFRDIGGYPTIDGKHTTWRKIFRSQTLSYLTDDDTATIKALGIKTVIDFRGDDEVRNAPSKLPKGVYTVRIPITVETGNDTTNIMQLLMSGALDSAQCVSFMEHTNRDFVNTFQYQYKTFFNILLNSENYPLIFHCTAGKDRTGFAAAILLSALDVEWDTIMEDYMLTNNHLNMQSLISNIPAESLPAFRQMLIVKPNYLNAAKDEITKRYGIIDNYLLIEMGIGKSEKEILKKILTTKD